MKDRITLYAFVTYAVLVMVGYFAFATVTDARAAKANARADSMAVVARAEVERTAEVLATHDSLAAVLEALGRRAARVDTVVIRARAAVPPVAATTPATDTIWKARSLAQDVVIAAQDSAIAFRDGMVRTLRADNANLSTSLLRSTEKLAAAAAELERQSRRTERAPRKLLGLIPMPVLTIGYGAGLADGKIATGPQLTLGWKVSL
jgi:non-ribosomal peptide synthetase component E (peptide arylation enzyme)